MKKITISFLKAAVVASGALCAFGAVAAAQGYSFTTDLGIGATGTAVTALQAKLIADGYKIPSIISGAAAKGRFGGETRNAVRLYQKAMHIPATGFVGPLTRASLNGVPSTVTAASKAAASASTTVPRLQAIMTPGAIGSLSLSLWPAPSDNVSVSKGRPADIVAYKIQASNSDMAVKSLSIDFNTRIWLYAGSFTITDDQGTIVAQVNNLNQSNFSELTVGSNYRITIPVAGYFIAHSSTRILTVSLGMLGVSDRSAGSISTTRLEVRAVDGTATDNTQILSATRTFSYTGSGAGEVVITVDPNSPPNMLATISRAVPTENIPLGVVDFTSQGQDGNMRSLTAYLNTSADTTTDISNILRTVKIQSGTQVYPADSILYTPDGSVITFTNMSIALPKDQPVPIALLVDVNADTNGRLNGISASTTILASGTAGGTSNNPVIEDSSLTTMAVREAPLLSSDITFSESDANFYSAAPTATLGAALTNNNRVTGYNMTFTIPITAGNNTLYISSDTNVALATTSSGFGSNASTSLPLAGTTVNPGNLSGDTNVTSTNGYYVIPAGSTRTFTFNGSMNGIGSSIGLKTFAITGVRYGTSTAALSANTVVYYNYGTMKVVSTF